MTRNTATRAPRTVLLFALVAALGGPEVATNRKILDPDMQDPRFEMELSPSFPFRRRGERRRAALVGGASSLFILSAGIHAPLVDAGLIATPYMISFAFLAIVLVMCIAAFRIAVSIDIHHLAVDQAQLALGIDGDFRPIGRNE